MKLKNLKQELEFIRSAEPQELMSQVVKTRFSTKAEKPLIRRGISDISLFYIKAYGLKEAAQIEVFRTNHPKLVEAVLETSADPGRTMVLFLAHGEYNTVMKYLKRHDVPQYTERELVWYGKPEEILHHVRRHRISPFARYDLIRRGNPAIIRAIIAKGRLNEREKLEIMTHGAYDEVEFLVQSEANPAEEQKLRQMQMIRFSSRKKLEKYIRTRRFYHEVEDFFFKLAPFAVLISYIKHYQIENGQELLLKRNDRPELLSYLSKNWLCEEGAKLLLKLGIHAEIKAYIKKHYFNDEQEVHFIKRGKHREIMLYLANHSLCDKAQIELIYRRNQAEITYFISHYPLADAAVDVLYKCGSDEAINLWQNTPYPLLRPLPAT